MNTPSPLSLLGIARVGIVGGGQLARMMAEAAPAIGLSITVLDPAPNAPASEFAPQIIAAYDDLEALQALASTSDVVTIDIEAVSAASLAALEAANVRVAPSSKVLGIIQDKLLQKEFLNAAGLPVGRYAGVEEVTQVIAFGLPCILKARRHGYDGRGVKRVRTAEEASHFLGQGPCLAEEIVDIKRELAVMIARNTAGEIALYPVVEAEFDPAANILNTIIAPALVSPEIAARCGEQAMQAVAALDGVGIFGIEFFLTHSGEVILNEISPRPHNSGHYTIEACATSQFEQHLRAVSGLPLGATTLLHPATSFNLLGAPDAHGEPAYHGLDTAATPGVAVHLYGKHRVSPYRKMGHVTVTASDRAAALQKANELQQIIRVEGSEQ